MSLQVPRAGLRLTRGTPSWWTRATDSGNRLECAFCANCGSRLWHQPDHPSEHVTLKAGSLDEPVDVASAVHIWVSRKIPGVVIPEGAAQFPEEPD